jgi:hypothetical protein
VYKFVLNPIATNGCVSPRIFLNSAFVPRRKMSETTPQTTTGDRHDNRNRRGSLGRHDNEEIPTALRRYRFDIDNNNPAEIFERITKEVAQYVATQVQGAGYMRRALIGLEEPKLLPPPKPKAPEEPDDADDEDEWAIDEMEKAQQDADSEVWKEEVKLVARRRIEQKINILPSVYAVVWRKYTSEIKSFCDPPTFSKQLTRTTTSSPCSSSFVRPPSWTNGANTPPSMQYRHSTNYLLPTDEHDK